jgi:hypothetical protein
MFKKNYFTLQLFNVGGMRASGYLNRAITKSFTKVAKLSRFPSSQENLPYHFRIGRPCPFLKW